MRSVLYPPRRRPSNLGKAPLTSPPLSTPMSADVAEKSHDMQATPLVAIVPAEKGKGEETTKTAEGEAYVLTTRFEHAATADGDFILTGRDGKLQRCEDEVSEG